VAAASKIKNLDGLLASGDRSAREIVLSIVDDALDQLDSRRLIGSLLQCEGRHLRIGELRWDLSQKRRVVVVGAGKAGNAMALGVEDALGKRIAEGLVIVKDINRQERLSQVQLVRGGHHLPNEEGLKASRRILELVDRLGPEDLVIGLISGGSSALMSCPVPGISLEDEMRATELLLKSGARILEINAVRRHISATNGGRLAQRVEGRGAEMINLILSDGVGARPTVNPQKPVTFYGTPVAPDKTTLEDARAVIGKYALAHKVPASILIYLDSADQQRETPKTLKSTIHHFVLERPADACEAAAAAAARAGLPGRILTTVLEGESAAAGGFLACIAQEARLNGRPAGCPCILIAGGETTTRVDGSCGEGGPSQELSLGFALEAAGRGGVCMAAIDTDGTDGPTEFAGGLTDGMTVDRARALGIDLYDALRRHDSSTLLQALGDVIVTGTTGTNVCDLNVIYVGPEVNLAPRG
jgi:glycerate 2-kinase